MLLLPTEDDSLIVTAAAGTGARRMIGAVLEPAHTPEGDVMTTDRPHVSDHATAFLSGLAGDGDAPRGPTALLPLTAGGHVIGVLAVLRRGDAEPFTEADVRMVHTFAGHAALAVEFARAREDRQRLAVFEDRERIARDLHDLIIQRLFATGLGLQGVTPLITRPDVAEKVSGFVDDLDETIRDVRRTIFSLQEPLDQPSGLRGEVLQVASTAASTLGFQPHVSFAGPIDSVVPDDVRPDLLATLGEALTNVARHARATRVKVGLDVEKLDRQLVLTVEDDGVGPDPQAPPGHGTVNMAARARRFGGSSTLTPADGGGARLTWHVPLSPTG